MERAGEWLEKALVDLCRRTDGLDLDGDLISGLVSYCDLAPPLDSKEYLDTQEGEGPCSFCRALVLKEGSTYTGLEEEFGPLSDADAAAEAYAKRLVDYDRNSAARTTVIDDQSDYYEIEGNSWFSMEVSRLC